MTTLEGRYPLFERRDGYEIHRFPSLAWPLENPITVSMLAELFSQFSLDRFDIVHAHSHLLATTNLAAFVRFFRRIPLVITNHGFMVARGPTLDVAQKAFLQTVGRLTLSGADGVISFTKRERQRVTRLGVDPKRAVVIPNGVDTSFFAPRKASKDENLILWTGRFVPEKGLTYLLQAMKRIITKKPNAKLSLIGYGAMERYLQRLSSELDLTDNVEFLGIRSPTEIVEYLNRCTVFVHPSLSEGFPSSVLEAMACQRPVVVTRGIGLEPIVSSAGLYNERGDPGSIAEKILAILNDRDLGETMGRIGRQHVVAAYDWWRVMEDLDKLYSRFIF